MLSYHSYNNMYIGIDGIHSQNRVNRCMSTVSPTAGTGPGYSFVGPLPPTNEVKLTDILSSLLFELDR